VQKKKEKPFSNTDSSLRSPPFCLVDTLSIFKITESRHTGYAFSGQDCGDDCPG
jgi:hypothetical protein